MFKRHRPGVGANTKEQSHTLLPRKLEFQQVKRAKIGHTGTDVTLI
jgi:hypothetical protein